MKSIKEIIKNELVIKKSKFITLLYPVSSEEDISVYLENIKREYKGATHYCYAYKIKVIEKCSDDGEPSKTAGMPILNVLKNEELDYVLAIVIRYFGGIKLGAGGLVRAYSKSVRESITDDNLCELENGYEIQVPLFVNIGDKIRIDTRTGEYMERL